MNHETAAEGGLYLPKGYHNKLIKAVMQFGLIEDGDNVLVGFSGGKDSAFLMYALKSLQLYSPLSFSLGSATVDLGFDESLGEDAVTEYARRLAMPHGFIRTKAFEVIKQRSEASPCAWCSYFRRASINTYARKNGYNKVAYAHHMDDAMETLMMNMLYSGRGGTFLPRTELTRSGITVIRPLIYFSEREVTKALKFMGFTPLESPCPYSGDTSRARVKKLIKELDMENRMVRRNIEAVVKAWLEPRIVSPGPENC